MYAFCVVGLHVYHLRWRFLCRSYRVSGIWPVKSLSRRSQENVQGASEKIHHGLKHLSWHWTTSPACAGSRLSAWDGLLSLVTFWAVGLDVSPLFVFFFLSEGRGWWNTGDNVGQEREWGRCLLRWTHSHSWSEREENTYWFPDLSLHNYLLSTSFWGRNMCLVRSWKLCLEVSRVLAKRQLIPRFYLELQESFVEFF